MQKILLLSISILTALNSFSQSLPLDSGFKSPPSDAKPRVWWHWMNGNVSKAGITADLEWMKRVGIGGAQIFDVDLRTPRVVDQPITFMSPEWQDALHHAGAEADRLGLDLGIAASGGWSESGGPWVKPEEGMKQVVWADTLIEGPQHFSSPLPKPNQWHKNIKILAFHLLDTVAIPLPGVRSLLDKAQYRVSAPDAQQAPNWPVGTAQTIDPCSILDVTKYLKTDGTLEWTIPAGKWVIERLGYGLTGRMSRFATAESNGLEVDKLSRRHTETYINEYLARLTNALGPALGKSFQNLLVDSWEVGVGNWTEEMISEFQKRRGYNPTPFLPVLAGWIVGSADLSDRFLCDFRRTIADMLAENHFGVINEYVQKKGMRGTYGEVIGVEQPTTGDGLQAKGQVTVPMGEFVLEPWRLPGGRETNKADMREAASAAHIYGKTLAAAESFTTTETTPWAQAPYDLKPYADWAMANGINQFVIHTSAHQPFTDGRHKPGITLGIAGQNYTRNNTWGEQSIAFNSYLARSSYLLQQGLFVGDLLYYYGEDAPVVVPYWKAINPAPPIGYDYDWLNTEVLLKDLSVRDGRLILTGGMSYRLLVIPADITRLTLPVVRKLRELVAAGANILSPRPTTSPSLADYPAGDDSIRAIANTLWGMPGGYRRHHEPVGHPYGKGKIFSGPSVQEVLDSMGILPDFRYGKAAIDDTLVWIHRRTSNEDIYFIANQRPAPMDFVARFRVANKEPELWHPDDGSTEPIGFTFDSLGTTVPLHLDPRGSVFVVFRRPAMLATRPASKRKETLLTKITGPWMLKFPPDWGAPAQIKLDSLQSWATSKDPGVKYFSGTATYVRDIFVPRSWFHPNAEVVLDLGVVKEVAEISVNGRSLGILWKPPFRIDIKDILKVGMNYIEIKVTNLWPNRMIGDLQPGVTKPFTFALIKPFEKDSPLLESGLLGPVKVYMSFNSTN